MQHCSFEKHKSTLFFEKNSQPHLLRHYSTLFSQETMHAVNTVFPKRYSTLFFPLKLVNPFLPRHYSTLTIWCTITVSTKCRPNVYKLEFIFSRGQICTDWNCEYTLCQIQQRLQLLTYFILSTILSILCPTKIDYEYFQHNADFRCVLFDLKLSYFKLGVGSEAPGVSKVVSVKTTCLSLSLPRPTSAVTSVRFSAGATNQTRRTEVAPVTWPRHFKMSAESWQMWERRKCRFWN